MRKRRHLQPAETLEPRLLLAAVPPAQIAYDLDPRNGSGFPTTGNDIVVAGARAFFVPDINSDFQTHGNELWVSDGTAAGTHMVKDLTPGRVGTNIDDLVPVGQNVLFSASVPTLNGQVYLSDGTDAGTIRLTDPAVMGLTAAGVATIARSADGGTVYFFGVNTSDQSVIVRSDGTLAGTAVVATNVPGLGTGEIGLAGNRLYYQSFVGSVGWELFSVDLTTGASGMVKDINPGSSSSFPESFGTVGNKVLFFATTAASGKELWSSDGTPAGTSMVTELVAGTSGVSVLETGTANGAYLFMRGRDLWRSDGSAGGTALVETLELSTTPSFAEMGSGTQRGFIYVSSQSTLITTDGTAAGTFRIFGPTGSPFVASALGLPSYGDGQVFLDVTDSANGREIWTTDGTLANTRRVSDVAPGNSTASSAFFAKTNRDGSLAFFVATDATIGNELWTATAAAGSGHLVMDVNQSGMSSTPEHVTAAGVKLFYERFNGMQPGLWATDTVTNANTFLGAFESVSATEPRSAAFGNKIIYSGRIGTSAGVEPYVSDGTLAGTFRLGDLFSGVPGSEPSEFIPLGTRMFFRAKISSSDSRIFRTDGTVAGTQRVLDQLNGAMAVFGDKLYFASTGGSLWRVGETGAAEQVVASGDGIGYLAASQGRLLIFRNKSTGEKVLQTYDGVNPVQTVATLPSVSSIISSVAELNGVTMFSYGQLWRTDFTAAGTVAIGGAPVNGSEPDVFRVLNGVMIYHGSRSGVAGIWRSDGTPAGTYNVKPDIFTPDELTVFGGRVYLTGGGPVDGTRKLWVTDGTAAGTTQVMTADGITPVEPRWLQATATALYFAADDQDRYGRELWKLVPSTGWFSGNAGATSWDAATNTLTVTGVASIVAEPGPEVAPNVSVTGPSAVLTIAPSTGRTVTLQSLALANGASATLPAGGARKTLVVSGSFSINSGARFDLADQSMILRGGGSGASGLAGVQAAIAAGFNSGNWNGLGLVSSAAANDPARTTALGVATAADISRTSFAGVSDLAPTDVLVRYTYYGDTDLSGVTTLDDFTLFLSGYQSQAADKKTWAFGDFDYSGLVTLDDFTLFLKGYQNQGPPLP